jgi:hypothetical protein
MPRDSCDRNGANEAKPDRTGFRPDFAIRFFAIEAFVRVAS